MSSLSGPQRKAALRKIVMLAYLRTTDDLSEEQIADKVGFGSPEAMDRQLKSWSLQELLWGGLSAGERTDRERKARQGGGKAKETRPSHSGLHCY